MTAQGIGTDGLEAEHHQTTAGDILLVAEMLLTAGRTTRAKIDGVVMTIGVMTGGQVAAMTVEITLLPEEGHRLQVIGTAREADTRAMMTGGPAISHGIAVIVEHDVGPRLLGFLSGMSIGVAAHLHTASEVHPDVEEKDLICHESLRREGIRSLLKTCLKI